MEKLKNALLLVSKPYGITSRKFLNEIGKVLDIKRIGHLGTLDPMATGLLFIATGKYTRLLPYVDLDTKEYIIEITFGIETDTWDTQGKIIRRQTVNIKENDILKILPQFVGEIKQRVPFFSAKKIEGIELYKLARRKTFIEIFKQAKILDIEYIGFKNNKLILRVASEKGAYMRALAYEIGEKLNAPATLSAIVRTKIGNLSIEDATTLTKLKNNDFSRGIINPMSVISLPSVILRNKTNYALGKPEPIDKVLVFDDKNSFIGIGKVEDNSIKPKILIDEDTKIV